MGEQTPLGTPGPLTQAAIDKAKSLPNNQLDLGAGTSDFRSVDLTVGVKKTWQNGWGVGAWIGAKVGAGKPVGSAGVTVSKSLGLLGELETMNWLQRNLPSRESWYWVAGTVVSIVTFLGANFDAFEAAFGVDPIWEKRIGLLAGLAAALIAKQGMSWVPTRSKQEKAIDLHVEKKLGVIDRDIDKAIERIEDERP